MNAQTETFATKPDAPLGVDQGALDSVVEATERRMTDEAILHVFNHIDAYKAMAASIARSGMTHHKTEAHVITIAMAAYEMHLPVTTALRGMFLVGGKLAMETWLLDLLAVRLGVTKTVKHADREKCELVLHRDGWDDLEVSFSVDDAVRAGLVRQTDKGLAAASGKSIWLQYTEEMLYWRALAKGLRRIAPDLFGGVYVTEEADGFDHRRNFEPDATDTNKELEELMHGVEPDPDIIDFDEQVRISDELNAAVRRGCVERAQADDVLAHIHDGRWTEAREALDAVRSEVLRADGDGDEPELDLSA